MRKVKNLISDKFYNVLLIIPLIFILLLLVYPILYNFKLSLHNVNIETLIKGNYDFIGLDNYINIFNNENFYKVIVNTVIFTVSSVAFQFLFGLFLALFFIQDFPLNKFLRGLFLIGWVIPPVVVGTIWRWLLNPDIGIINFLISLIGFKSIPWLVDRNTAMFGVIIANVWLAIPFNMLLITSALTGIPKQIIDAAEIDGANILEKIIYVILPAIKPAINAIIILDIIYTFRGFALIWGMTKGGPVNATTILPVWSYENSFVLFEFGQGAAISNIMFLFLLVLSLIYIKLVDKED